MLLVRGIGPADCTGVALVISAEAARDACKALPHVDRSTVWRDGAHAVWLRHGTASVLSDRAYRGERPWVARSQAAPPARTTLPLALTDSDS